MLATCFGTSTLYAYWGFALIGNILDEVYGVYCYIHCLTREELRSGWQARDGRTAFVTSDLPEPALAALLLEFDFPIIAFIDHPEDAIDVAIRTRDWAPDQSCRSCTQFFSCLEPVLASPKTRVFGPEWYDKPLSEMGRALVRILFNEDDEDLVARALRRALPDWSSSEPPTVWQALRQRFPMALPPLAGLEAQRPAHQSMIRAVADAYRPIFEGRELANLEWPKDLFYYASEGCVSPDDIELLGIARHLVWGPYLFLPLGHWRVQIEFEIVENLSGNKIEADVVIGRVVAVKNGVLPAMGVYQFSMDFSVADFRAPIEVRIRLLTGAIEGRFGLRRMTLIRRRGAAANYLPGAENPSVPKLVGT